MAFDKKTQDLLDKTADAVVEHIEGRFEKQDEWISRVERTVNTARSHGPGRDGGLAAIPEVFRKDVDIAERHGVADPIGFTMRAAWLSCKWHERAGAFLSLGRPAGDYRKMADDIEKGWGYDPVVTKAAIGEVVGSGNMIIATPVEAELYRLIRDNTIVRPLATKIAMVSLTHQIPCENSNVTAFIVPETTIITDSMAVTSFKQQPLTARMFAGLATVSNQVFQDSIFSLQQYMLNAIAEHIGILEDQGALDGGTPTVQNFSGVAVASGVNSMAVNGTGVSGGTAPTFAELMQCIYTGAQQATRRQAAFFMLPSAFRNIASLVDTTGQPIFSFANVPNAIPQFVGGYPVYLVSALSSAWSAATTSTNIYFGPPSTLILGDVSGMTMDIDIFGLFNTLQTRVRVCKRSGILAPIGSAWTIMKQVKY